MLMSSFGNALSIHLGNMFIASENTKVVRIHKVYQDPNHIYIVTDFLDQGDLFQYLARRESPPEEWEVAQMIDLLTRVLLYCHQKDKPLGNLKPNNILFSSQPHSEPVQISDIGLPEVTKSFSANQDIIQFCAPELSETSKITSPGDIWALGVILYFIVSSEIKNVYESEVEVSQEAIDEVFGFQEEIWADYSSEIQDFIRSCLRLVPEDRNAAAGLLQHIWLQNYITRPAQQVDAGMGK